MWKWVDATPGILLDLLMWMREPCVAPCGIWYWPLPSHPSRELPSHLCGPVSSLQGAVHADVLEASLFWKARGSVPFSPQLPFPTSEVANTSPPYHELNVAEDVGIVIVEPTVFDEALPVMARADTHLQHGRYVEIDTDAEVNSIAAACGVLSPCPSVPTSAGVR